MLRRRPDEDYVVGSRQLGSVHVGLSVVATDVGGGFSIGLGGLGFTMGLSGSWLLFTGLVGAWLAAVIVIPRIKPLGDRFAWTTFPEYLEHRYDARTRLVAAIVSATGYAAFVGAQILAGATLAEVVFGIDRTTAVLVMAGVIIAYTAFGGLAAVVFTDMIQWSVLLVGLLGLALPLAWVAVGGLEGLRAAVPPEHLTLTNVTVSQLVLWTATIVPIWFVGNTLYQRIYASRDLKSAQRAWYLAGLLEWPLMAFAGAGLGLLGRALFPDADPEAALPMVIRDVLPMGAVGLVLAAYFSAIMSTADSCLLASIGHLVRDGFERHGYGADREKLLRLSRVLTVAVGTASVMVALALPRVLDAVLLAYGFMVSGLFVPTIAGLLGTRTPASAAFWSMMVGGTSAVVLSVVFNFIAVDSLWGEPAIPALLASAVVLLILSWRRPRPDPSTATLERP